MHPATGPGSLATPLSVSRRSDIFQNEGEGMEWGVRSDSPWARNFIGGDENVLKFDSGNGFTCEYTCDYTREYAFERTQEHTEYTCEYTKSCKYAKHH